jgi:dTDP-4-dehydrorhamnose reductase
MKRVAILGATGMLGSAVYDVLKDKYELVLLVRDKNKIPLLEQKFGGTGNSRVVEFDAAKVYEDYVAKNANPSPYLKGVLDEVGEVDYMINGIGITIPYALENPALTLFINGALPNILSQYLGQKLIHITTDCVYNGTEGFPYDEQSLKTPVDIYGLSKSLGEPSNCLTIRTSIIGRELEGFTGLLEWFLKQDGQDLKGFTQHFWNGITTKQFGKICDQIMQDPDKYPRSGLYHVFSTSVSKYEMLVAFQNKYDTTNNIGQETEAKLNRCLASNRELQGLLNVPSFQEMIDEL